MRFYDRPDSESARCKLGRCGLYESSERAMKKKTLLGRAKIAIIGFAFLCALFVLMFTMVPVRRAEACHCAACNCGDTAAAVAIVIANHVAGRAIINNWTSTEHALLRGWLYNTFFLQHILPALMLMTEQLSVVGMQQVQIIGAFLDAKHQLETQRLFQELRVQAHKDYHPSEDFCWFGTNARSLGNSESLSGFHTLALSQIAMARHLGNANVSASRNRDQDFEGRWRQFIGTYCDPKDNNWQPVGAPNVTGLILACGAVGGTDANRKNRDIDYTRLIDEPRTLNVELVGGNLLNGAPAPADGDEEDVLAMAKNLYGHLTLTRRADGQNLQNKDAQQLYLALRSVAAKRSVAENSFNSIVGLKVGGTSDMAAPNPQTREYMAAVLAELGIPNAEIWEMFGHDRPSYYAQLEILAKKIYQNPDFYANLYDKPANVARKKVALQAIGLMLDQEIYESQIRQEMVMSVLLSSSLRNPFRDVNKDMINVQ